MNKNESIEWLYGFHRYGSKLGLERISTLVQRLGNPEKKLKIIHITGTNGKGSVCQFVGSILHQAGYKTGVYISPHLERFSERITIDVQEISDKEIENLVLKIRPIVDEMIQEKTPPTFFEIVTAMAFIHFSANNVDFAVIEVGLGGRFDATNVAVPMVSVITNISIEHSQQLGEDVRSIAHEKAGIIKDGVSVVTAADHDALKVIEEVARKHRAPLTLIEKQSWQRRSYTLTNQEFFIHGFLKDYRLMTSLLGEYQGENIALTVAVVEHLQMRGVFISDQAIINGIAKADNPGRMEILSEQPLILLDGAHNPTGMMMLKESLVNDFEYQKLIIVLGILKDKDIDQMISIIIPVSECIIVTSSKNPRACDPLKLEEKIQQSGYSKELVVKESIEEAIDYSKTIAGKEDLICICGSLFTVGEARQYLMKKLSQSTVSS